MTIAAVDRNSAVKRAAQLEYFTIGWNSLEAVVSIAAGIFAGSVSLAGFGFDSLIEVTSGTALLWRIHYDHDQESRERNEKRALRIVGICFLALAAYLAFESLSSIIRHERPNHSPVGVVVTALSVVVMPLLARAKRRVAVLIQSEAMKADAVQTDFCMYLSAITLSGLVTYWLLGWWWADPITALLMVPLIAHEGIEAFRGQACGCSSTHG